MSEGPTLLDKLKAMNEVKLENPEATLPETGTMALAALQKAARETQQAAKDAEWALVADYDYKKIPPPVMAKLYYANGYGTMAQCLLLALERYETGKNPAKGEAYIIPGSGRLGTSLQGMLVELKNQGHKVGKPVYTSVTRPWAKGLVLFRKEKGTEIKVTGADFDDKEPGKTCKLMIDDEEMEYTCWLSEWFMGANPNWWGRMGWMLEIRAQMNCIKMGSGVAISEDLQDAPTEKETPEPKEPKAPKSVPFAAGTK